MSKASTGKSRPPRRLPVLVVTLLLSGMLFAVFAQSASALPQNFFGLMPAGGQINTESDLEAAARSGAKYWRLGFNCFAWYENKTGIWQDWDHQVELAWNHGLQVFPTIESRCTQVSGDIPHEGEWGTWDEFVAQLVAHYGYNGSFWQGKENKKEIENWEIQNEPNLSSGGVDGYANGYTYARLFQRTSEDLHADQGSFFPIHAIFGGLLYGPIDTSGPKTQTPHDFLQAASAYTSVKPWIDGVAIHPYEFGENAVSRSEADISEARADVDSFFGSGKSLWITEVGWPAEGHGEPPDYPETTLASQADALKHLFDWVKLEQGSKDIQSLIFYMYRDYNWNGNWDSFCGLRDEAGSERYAGVTFRPAWYTYQEETDASRWPVSPGVETQAATGVTQTSATLSGVVDPHGLPTGYHFEWAKGSEGFSHQVPGQAADAGWEEGNVSEAIIITDLNPSTEYHFRIIGSNENHETSVGVTKSFKTLRTPRPAHPAVAPSGTGWEGVFWRGTDGNIFESIAPSGEWLTYSPTWSGSGIPSGVTAIGNPAVAPSGTGWQGVFWRGSDGNIYESLPENGEWVTYSPTWSRKGLPSGVTVASDPVVAPSGTGWQGVFWRGSDGNIYESLPENGEWVSYSPTWSELPSGVTVASDPVVAPSGTGWQGVFWRGSDGNIYESLPDEDGEWVTYSPTWSRKGLPSGVTAEGDPVVAPSGTGWQGVFWRGSDGNIYESLPENGEWVSYSPTWSRKGIPSGIQPVGDPVVAPSGTGWQGVFWRGSDGNIYESLPENGEWVTYSPTWSRKGLPPGVVVDGEPVVAPSGTGWQGVFWRGSDGNIYESLPENGEWVSYSPTWSRNGLPPGVTMAANTEP